MQKIVDERGMKELLPRIIKERIKPEAFDWLSAKLQDGLPHFSAAQSGAVFTAIPRKTGKEIMMLTEEEKKALHALREGFAPDGWTIDRFCRVWWLLYLPAEEEETYLGAVENLFRTADMDELAALYAAFPLLRYPEKLKLRAAEGIRTNIGAVFDAVVLNNPYPAEYLDEPAWNQLVLKAFFMDKPVQRIIGLDERANERLAHILTDYAHERWSAKRTVSPQLWRPVGKFIDESIIGDIKRLFASDDALEKEAAALACSRSEYPAAKALLNEHPGLKGKIAANELNWQSIAEKLF